MVSRSVDIFDEQFRRQVQEGDFELNPFEIAAMGFLKGAVLDFGCGLGNLSLEAARRGHPVFAVDASAAAIQRIQVEAKRHKLPVETLQADLGTWQIHQRYDTISAIGILTYFPRPKALQILEMIQSQVNPGGRLILNSLIEGSTYFDLFDGDHFYLFAPGELENALADWQILYAEQQAFDAPGGRRKLLSTVIAQKPN